jgi:broad specificity phosphatase PhoE
MSVRTIYLVRHGQYESDLESKDTLGGSLTPLGKEQSERTAEALKLVAVNAVYTSTLRRASETAAAIVDRFPGVSVQPLRELWEIVPAIPPRESEYFALHFPTLTPEVIARDRQTADKAFTLLFRPASNQDTHDVIVCHGNLIRYFVCKVLDVPPETWANMETNNCGITRCTVESDGRKMLISMNDVGHLPLEMRTFT